MKSDSRYLGAVIIAPILIFVFLGGLPLRLLTILLSFIGLHEFYSALKNKDYKPFDYLGYIMIILLHIVNGYENILLLLILATIISLIIPVINLKVTFIDSALTILGFIYVGFLFSFLPMIDSMEGGSFLIWLVFLGSWGCDTFAYYVGKYFGKRKLCPEVSPKKTIEGSIGGLLGSAILCGVYGIIVSTYVPHVSIIDFIIIGLLTGISGQFGDLVASSVKRYVGIKDYSNLIPGHGGILDRFDSILFNSLVVFYYLTFVLAM